MSELQASAIELRESQWQDFKCLKFFSIYIPRPVFECDSWSLFHLLAWQNHQSIPHNSVRFLQIGLFWQRMGNRDVASSNLSIYLHIRINLHIHRDPHLIFNTIFYMHVWKYTFVRVCVCTILCPSPHFRHCCCATAKGGPFLFHEQLLKAAMGKVLRGHQQSPGQHRQVGPWVLFGNMSASTRRSIGNR